MLRATIGTSLLAASLLVGGATAASAQAKPTLGPYGYGALKLGMTAAQAKATGALVLRQRGDKVICSGWSLKRFPIRENEVDVYISPRRGLAVIFARKGMKTPEGIRIGSTFRQLRTAYPHIKKDFHGFYVTKVPRNKKASYTFTVEKGKVTQFGLALNNQDCFN